MSRLSECNRKGLRSNYLQGAGNPKLDPSDPGTPIPRINPVQRALNHAGRWGYRPAWKARISEISASDGSARDQSLRAAANSRAAVARIGATLERKRLRDRERHYLDRLDAEKRRAEALLDNILPAAVIARLSRGERTIADRIEPVTVLFADIEGFTRIAARLSPVRLVTDLDRLVSAFDELATVLGVEKIKTVGDAYLAVAGVPEPRADHADAAAELAWRMTETVTALGPELGADYRLRVGLHSGPVLAGVIGRRKFSYDVWGDTVNVASRLQQLSVPGEVTISSATAAALGSRWRTLPLGEVELRGRGGFETHRLLRAG